MNSDNSPIPFLRAVAGAYAARYGRLSDICFVFPNKRSSTFFLNALSDALGPRPMLAPEVLDIESFVARVADRLPAPRLDLLFRLYKVYCGLLGRVDAIQSEADLLDFDRFAPWGETLVGDFSEVDKYDVDAEALFKNVRDYRSIATNFLTQEQLEVIERYFGYRPAAADVERFWRSVGDPADFSSLKEKFVELWKLLPELYAGLTASLEADALAMPGSIYRRAMHRVADEGRGVLPWSKVVVVGFNMISTTEAAIFSEMQSLLDDDGLPFAEFFWDATGPVLGPDSKSRGPAVKALRRNMKLFPEPEWAAPFMQRSMREGMPEITVAAAPSNSAQTKIAALTVEDWIAKHGIARVDTPRSAVVVPDENLLMPLLHSLPEELRNVNLTMGYSLRFTAVASFVAHLRRLQSRRPKSHGLPGFLRDDIRLILAHPLIHVFIGTNLANEINGDIANSKMRVVTCEWLADRSPELADLLTPIPASAGVGEVVDYVDRVLERLDTALHRTGDGLLMLNAKMERQQIAVYRLAISRLLASVRRHGVVMSWQSVFYLLDRLVAGEMVPLEGEPLRGLQVMGLLETRALDFERLVIMSMNDKVMPRRGRRRTFIPDTLRRGYGMPTATQGEELYSYYFYRLISRAREVVLIYDARAGEGMRSGGKSRFLMQLDMLHAPDQVRNVSYSFNLDAPVEHKSTVVKTPEVMERLRKFTLPEGGRNLSASALMNYCKCKAMFYYKFVAGWGDRSAPEDYVDPISHGNIVHESMLRLYFPPSKIGKYLRRGQRIRLEDKDFARLLDTPGLIEGIVRRAVNKHHFGLKEADCDRPLSGRVKMVAERLVKQVRDVVEYDRSLAPLELIGGEMSGRERLKIGDAPEVNIRYSFDRVDSPASGRVRMVDYKTGKAHVVAPEPEDIFNGNSDAQYLLQLLIYSYLLVGRMKREERVELRDVEMLIYDVNQIAEVGGIPPKVAKQTVSSHAELMEYFEPEMERIIKEIFDPSVPFSPAPTDDPCAFCPYSTLCRW